MDSTMLIFLMIAATVVVAVVEWALGQLEIGRPVSLEQIAELLGYGVLLGLSAYAATGVIPGVSALLAQISAGIPDSTTLLGLITAVIIFLYRYFTGSSSVSPTPTPDPAPAPGPFDPGFVVLPVSDTVEAGTPVTITFESESAGQTPEAAGSVIVYPNDGTTPSPITVTLSENSQNMMVGTLTHTFPFVQQAQYTDDVYYPKFILVSADGTQTETFNDVANGQGVDFWVEVQPPVSSAAIPNALSIAPVSRGKVKVFSHLIYRKGSKTFKVTVTPTRRT